MGDDLYLCVLLIVLFMMCGDNFILSIVGVESMNEFKFMMEFVFDEDD